MSLFFLFFFPFFVFIPKLDYFVTGFGYCKIVVFCFISWIEPEFCLSLSIIISKFEGGRIVKLNKSKPRGYRSAIQFFVIHPRNCIFLKRINRHSKNSIGHYRFNDSTIRLILRTQKIDLNTPKKKKKIQHVDEHQICDEFRNSTSR